MEENKAENIIHIEQGFGWFLGRFEDNKVHQHYAVQLCIPLGGAIKLSPDGGELVTTKPVLIQPNVEHKLTSTENNLLVLFNPLSPQGHFWNRLPTKPITELDIPAVKEIKQAANSFLFTKEDKDKELLNQTFRKYDCYCGEFVHAGDERIEKALAYLHRHADRVVPLGEVAGHCSLSPSRFQHVFKETTGQSFRRAQLWTKMSHALPHLGKQSLTSLAHQFGFADSAHFSRTFRENFGFSPRDLLKNSQFIQV